MLGIGRLFVAPPPREAQNRMWVIPIWYEIHRNFRCHSSFTSWWPLLRQDDSFISCLSLQNCFSSCVATHILYSIQFLSQNSEFSHICMIVRFVLSSRASLCAPNNFTVHASMPWQERAEQYNQNIQASLIRIHDPVSWPNLQEHRLKCNTDPSWATIGSCPLSMFII